MNQIKHILLEKIKPPKFDQRLSSVQEDDDDLMNSIKELGVLEPLLVKEVPAGYEIIFGHRRFKEAGRAGLPSVPCIITTSTEEQCEKMKLHENLKRLPLSHIDQGYTFLHLIKNYDLTEIEVSVLSGKSIAYVSQHISLVEGDPVIIQAVHDGRINFSVARELLRCKNPEERNRFQTIVEEHGATQTVVRSWVDEANRDADIKSGTTPLPVSNSLPETPQVPMYPCAACEVPISILDLKILRLCPDCHRLIFSDIETEKLKIRLQKSSTNA